MDRPELIKNVSFSEAHLLRDLVDDQKGHVVNRTLAQSDVLRPPATGVGPRS